jgi:uncharacterized protein
MLMIPGAAGSLEARYHTVPGSVTAPIVLVIPPHPEQDGTMDHPVVHTMFRVFARMGFHALRFNFRGSGQSQGTFVPGGGGEVSDAASCLDWLQNKNPMASQCWVAGFSFGAYVALQLLMRRPESHEFVVLSPLANQHDFSFLAPCPAPGFVLHGELNERTPKEPVIRLVHQLSLQKRGHKVTLNIVPQADHAFTDKLPLVEALIQRYVTQALERDENGRSALA